METDAGGTQSQDRDQMTIMIVAVPVPIGLNPIPDLVYHQGRVYSMLVSCRFYFE